MFRNILKNRKLGFLFAVLALSSCASSVALTGKNQGPKQVHTQGDIEKSQRDFDRKIEWFFRWRLDEDKKFNVMGYRKSRNGRDTLVLQIVNEKNEVLFEKDISPIGSIHRIYGVFALRKFPPQLAVEYDTGGSTSFLDMYDFEDGKILNLMTTNENDFDVNSEIRPFGIDPQPQRKPLHVILTSGSTNLSLRTSRVYEYSHGKYRKVGSFATSEVDELIIERITK